MVPQSFARSTRSEASKTQEGDAGHSEKQASLGRIEIGIVDLENHDAGTWIHVIPVRNSELVVVTAQEQTLDRGETEA